MTKLNIDCLNLIFNELRTDQISLYSCLLVNREWCNIVVPILWKEYSWSNESEKFLNLILSWLPSSSKQLLFNNDIKLPSSILLKPPLFNYISFCKFPNPDTVDRIIEMVNFSEPSVIDKIIEIVNFNNNSHKRNLLKQEIYKLFVSQCRDIKFLWWDLSQPLSTFPGATTCFSQLYKLDINFKFVNSNALNSNALYEMAQISRNLFSLSIINYSQDLPGLISLIDAQRNLKSVDLKPDDNKEETCEELSKALARKGNTINFLYLRSVIAIQPSILTSFINLKIISIHNNEIYKDFREEVKEFQHYLTISEFPDLQYLCVYNLSCFKELAMAIEKTKGNISEVVIFIYNANQKTKNTGMLIKAIANNCSKIQVLQTYFIPNDFIHIKSLLINCTYLVKIDFTMLTLVVNDENIGDELLGNFTKFSPNSLIDITINGCLKYSKGAFEQLFESYRKRNKFNFWMYDNNYITKGHKEIVRKYIREGVINMSNLG